MQISHIATFVILSFAISSCLPSEGIQRFEAVEAVVEREVQETARFAVSRLCDLRAEHLAEASGDTDMAIAMFFACGSIKTLVFNVIQAVNLLGMDITISSRPE